MSVNSRTDMNQHPEMFCGWCISRIIHFIVSLRLAHPHHRHMFISKCNHSNAHQRMAHSLAKAAAQLIAVLLAVACIAARLTFGGSPNPPSLCLSPEMATDLANETANSSSHDAKTLSSPSQPETLTPMLSPHAGAPLVKGLPLAVTIPVTHTEGQTAPSSFINDLTDCFLDAETNRAMQTHVVPLTMHCISRPHAGHNKPISHLEGCSLRPK